MKYERWQGRVGHKGGIKGAFATRGHAYWRSLIMTLRTASIDFETYDGPPWAVCWFFLSLSSMPIVFRSADVVLKPKNKFTTVRVENLVWKPVSHVKRCDSILTRIFAVIIKTFQFPTPYHTVGFPALRYGAIGVVPFKLTLIACAKA